MISRHPKREERVKFAHFKLVNLKKNNSIDNLCDHGVVWDLNKISGFSIKKYLNLPRRFTKSRQEREASPLVDIGTYIISTLLMFTQVDF